MLSGADLLITGGTGSFGRALVGHLLSLPSSEAPRRIIVFSRDELKQSEMARDLRDPHERLRFFLGDVRDLPRMRRAFMGVDYVIHAAALKQVPACEYNPQEAVKTNIDGAMNVVEAAIEAGVQRVVAISTDKACNPANLYGATKLAAEKIFVAGNALAGALATRFAVVRYGNVVGSRGSVVPLFLSQAAVGGPITITHTEMTRFWITLPQAVAFVLDALECAMGGEIFVPRLPTVKVVDLANAIAPGVPLKDVGMRHGEKLHETLVTFEEAPRTIVRTKGLVINPKVDLEENHLELPYTSDMNAWRLTISEVRDLLGLRVGAAT